MELRRELFGSRRRGTHSQQIKNPYWLEADQRAMWMHMQGIEPETACWRRSEQRPISRKTHNCLCIFKAKAFRGTELCSYLNFYSLYNLWKEQLYRISGSELCEWLFGLQKSSRLSRNGPHDHELLITGLNALAQTALPPLYKTMDSVTLLCCGCYK